MLTDHGSCWHQFRASVEKRPVLAEDSLDDRDRKGGEDTALLEL